MIGIRKIGIGLEIKRGGAISLLKAGQGTFAVDTESWTKYAANNMTRVIEESVSCLKVEYVDNTRGAYMFFKAASDIITDLTIGKDYTFKFRGKQSGGTVYLDLYDGSTYTAFAEMTGSFTEFEHTFTANSVDGCMVRGKGMSGVEIFYIDWWDLIQL